MPVLTLPRPRPAAPVDALARVAARQRVVEQVVEGRLTLAAGAARFRAAGGGPAAADETACRAVIGWAALALHDRPERAAAVADRLEDELRRLQGRAVW
jgi:hypothetical protein